MITFNDGEYIYTFDGHVLERFHEMSGSEKRIHIHHIKYARVAEREEGYVYEIQGATELIFEGHIHPKDLKAADDFVEEVNKAVLEAKTHIHS